MARIQRIASLGVIAASAALLAACVAQPNYGNANHPSSYPSGQPAYNNQYAQYGTVSNVEYLRQGQPTSGVAGAVAGGVVGGALGNQVGGGTGKALATVAGVVGGALIGRAIEQNVAGSHTVDVYRVTVRFDDGGARSFDYHQAPNVRVGDRVRAEGNQLYR